MSFDQFKQYIYLVRLNKPIGILLLLWPTLWALWLASSGKPDFHIVCIFVLGVVLTRSAGCIINDFADRKWDAYVERTRERPLATGRIKPWAALVLFGVLCLLAFLLVLMLNPLTIMLAFVGVGLMVFYPFMKRFTHLPQFGLGLAYAWGVPMAFAAQMNTVPRDAWWVFLTAAVWPVIYDTMYAMVDRADDVKVGIKSTAILFGTYDRVIIGVLQLVFLGLLGWLGIVFELNWPYFLSLGFVAILFGYQFWLLKNRDRKQCFKAFLNNHWIGLAIFLGIYLSNWSIS
ncbi:MAG: 4-hydroxybenzoate octaprenyltransferase [Gammaproteobacteria bacterium]